MQIQAGWKQQQLNALQASAADRTAIQSLAAAEHPAAYLARGLHKLAAAEHPVAYLARGLHKLMAEVNYIYQPEEAPNTGGGAMQGHISTQSPIIQLQEAGTGIAAIYPNPANTLVNVEYRLPTGSWPMRIELLDITGHVVQAQNINSLAASGSTLLNTATLAVGVYYCKATANERTLSIAKVLIVH